MAYLEAIQWPNAYIILYFLQETEDSLQFRTNIFPHNFLLLSTHR